MNSKHLELVETFKLIETSHVSSGEKRGSAIFIIILILL